MTLMRMDELTWTQVASLQRDLPLILPLGTGYDPGQIRQALGSDDVCMLPAIPFGWQGSPLVVPAQVFAPLVASLASNLLEDGFTRLSLLTPGVEVDAGIPTMHLPCHQDASPLPPDEARERVVLLPIGHTEQHGYHAPLATDTLIIEAVARGTEQSVPDRSTCLPVFPYGVSTHRRSFPGTFNVGGRVFEDFWLAVVDALAGRGFTRFYLLSGHGGNSSFLVNVVKYAGEKYPAIFCATAFLYLSGPRGIAALERLRQSPPGGMGHACELETSLILHLRPDLIHLEQAVDEMDFISTPSYSMDWIESGALVANPPWEDDTRTGAYGAGSLGTAEKGAAWLKAAVEEKVDHVAEIHEQYRRRRERRLARG